jgi:hypothetical protein
MAILLSSVHSAEERAGPREKKNFWRRLERILGRRFGEAADDPVCLSAFDESTLGRYGFNERQISLIKGMRAFQA